jgi:hypothetical protein
VYFESISAQLASISSELFWNANEIRVGSAKHMSPLDVIIASGTKSGPVTIKEIRDDAQLTLLTAISAFGILHIHISFEKFRRSIKTALEAQQLFEGHDQRGCRTQV